MVGVPANAGLARTIPLGTWFVLVRLEEYNTYTHTYAKNNQVEQILSFFLSFFSAHLNVDAPNTGHTRSTFNGTNNSTWFKSGIIFCTDWPVRRKHYTDEFCLLNLLYEVVHLTMATPGPVVTRWPSRDLTGQ